MNKSTLEEMSKKFLKKNSAHVQQDSTKNHRGPTHENIDPPNKEQQLHNSTGSINPKIQLQLTPQFKNKTRKAKQRNRENTKTKTHQGPGSLDTSMGPNQRSKQETGFKYCETKGQQVDHMINQRRKRCVKRKKLSSGT